MANYISLEEAAKKLQVTVDEVVEMLSRGEIFGYRDGTSWKFKPEEVERALEEQSGGLLDEGTDPSGSSLVISSNDFELGTGSGISGSRSGAGKSGRRSGSDLPLIEEGDDSLDSLGSGDLELGDELRLASDSGSEISLGDSKDGGLSIGPVEKSDVLGGTTSKSKSPKEMPLQEDEDELVLGTGSDVQLAADSNINLVSPSDSGLSLDDEPLDLAGSGISGLDLGGEGSGVKKPSASGSGSLVDFQQDQEFQLSPSNAADADDDSGSQVIELEDSADFGDGAVALPTSGSLDDLAADLGGGGLGAGALAGGGLGMEEATAAGPAVVRATPEIPFSMLQVGALLSILLLMGLAGILVTDIVRNLWAWSDSDNLTSGFTQMVIEAAGMK
jgi:excisionase family DNA binding protein